jgi:histidyl-tRNA synthetase
MRGFALESPALIKPRTTPGVMELLPRDQIAFQRMLDVIRRNYERFGFLPVETPVFELSEVLLTKTGGETERQVYFVQSTGSLEQGGQPELALRFDLTVPLARYVAEHEHDLAFPFRRYQIQRVYRGERAQRGRFREFYQCDIDVIGKDSLGIRHDAELPAVIHAVFTELGVGPFTIRLNNRKILAGLMESFGISDEQTRTLVLREIDKAEKQGREKTYFALLVLGLDEVTVASLLRLLLEANTPKDRAEVQAMGLDPDLEILKSVSGIVGHRANDLLRQGVEELTEVLQMLAAMGIPRSAYRVDLSIARGLDYYTGTVYETTLDEHPQIGSVCSGGRYEDLASHYTKSKLPGVGISIGATRLFWQLREAGILSTAESSVEVMVGLMDEARLADSLDIARRLRAAGINAEVQLDAKKLAKQFQYADRAGIRFVVLYGDDEAARGVVKVKDLRSQEQFDVARDELAAALKVELEQQRAMGLR